MNMPASLTAFWILRIWGESRDMEFAMYLWIISTFPRCSLVLRNTQRESVYVPITEVVHIPLRRRFALVEPYYEGEETLPRITWNPDLSLSVLHSGTAGNMTFYLWKPEYLDTVRSTLLDQSNRLVNTSL
jgi:hypothetical protein